MNSSSGIEDTAASKVKAVNPWLGIWTRQRDTLLYVWQNLLESYVHRLFILAGLVFMLAARLPDWSTFTPHPIGVMIQMLMFAPMAGLFAGYLFAGALKWVGKRMGREVPSLHTRAMVAWSNLPFIAGGIIYLIVFYLLNPAQHAAHPKAIWVFKDLMGWLPLLVALPMYLWAVVVRIRSIAVLLGVPTGKAAVAWLLTTLIAYVPAGGLVATYFVMYYVTISSGAGS